MYFACLFCLIVVCYFYTILQKSCYLNNIITVMEVGTVKAHLLYMCETYITCWVWKKWKSALNAIVGWQCEVCKMLVTDHSLHLPGSLLQCIVCKTMVCYFVVHHSSQICGMVVTAVWNVMPTFFSVLLKTVAPSITLAKQFFRGFVVSFVCDQVFWGK